MLIRKCKKDDAITVGDIVIVVRKQTDDNLTLAIAAPDHMIITHARSGQELHIEQSDTGN
jgi:sRNA-binding carbon storage regulator CsrA